ncbi:hypothetical protein CMI47_19840 [Candidatus Pacearchaeota archaeon]|nr:hypothetical protein [Candidatus Pacearchaeota archaeon]|tara:strand:+ start:8069 stop:8440 length:372 start_codon:yes stop_codon:yes gene_type:complete
MATATLQQTCTNQAAGASRIVATITAAANISDKLFVFRVADVADNDTYDRVATPFDVDTWPEARDANQAFYRLATVTFDFDNVTAAIKGKAALVTRITQAVKEYADAQDTFVEVLTSEIDSDD